MANLSVIILQTGGATWVSKTKARSHKKQSPKTIAATFSRTYLIAGLNGWLTPSHLSADKPYSTSLPAPAL